MTVGIPALLPTNFVGKHQAITRELPLVDHDFIES